VSGLGADEGQPLFFLLRRSPFPLALSFPAGMRVLLTAFFFVRGHEVRVTQRKGPCVFSFFFFFGCCCTAFSIGCRREAFFYLFRAARQKLPEARKPDRSLAGLVSFPSVPDSLPSIARRDRLPLFFFPTDKQHLPPPQGGHALEPGWKAFFFKSRLASCQPPLSVAMTFLFLRAVQVGSLPCQ